jgi:hypothetical protein
MLCPLLPGLADDEASINELVAFCLDCGAEEIFAEPVNPRPGLRLVQEALLAGGFSNEAEQVRRVRNKTERSAYVARLLRNIQTVLARHGALAKLRFLLYPSNLQEADLQQIEAHDQGVKWLGKDHT